MTVGPHAPTDPLTALTGRFAAMEARLKALELAASRPRPLVETDTYTPSLANIAIGTGGSAENTGNYVYVGSPGAGGLGLMIASGTVVLGSSGASVSGQPTIGLPSGFQFPVVDTERQLPGIFRLDPDGGGGSKYAGTARIATASTFVVNFLNTTGGLVIMGAISASTPAVWSAGGWIRWSFTASVVRA